MRGWHGIGALAVVVAVSFLTLATPVYAANATPDENWKNLADALFPGQTLIEGGTVIKVGTPLAAENAALVPVTLHMNYTDPDLPANDPRRVKKVTLVIDENPSPVAAVFELGPKAGVTKI